MELAEEHRLHIGRWFYDCTREMHARLTQMYVNDERFAAHYEAVPPRTRRLHPQRGRGERPSRRCCGAPQMWSLNSSTAWGTGSA